MRPTDNLLERQVTWLSLDRPIIENCFTLLPELSLYSFLRDYGASVRGSGTRAGLQPGSAAVTLFADTLSGPQSETVRPTRAEAVVEEDRAH